MAYKKKDWVDMTSTKYGKRALTGYAVYGASVGVAAHNYRQVFKKQKSISIGRAFAPTVTAIAGSTYGQYQHGKHLNEVHKRRKGRA